MNDIRGGLYKQTSSSSHKLCAWVVWRQCYSLASLMAAAGGSFALSVLGFAVRGPTVVGCKCVARVQLLQLGMKHVGLFEAY